MADITRKIEGKSKNGGVVDLLTETFTISELQSLLLEVYKRKTAALDPKDIYQDYLQNRFVHSSSVSPKMFLRFDETAFASLPKEFATLELSPLAPLGMCSVLAPVHQNNVVSTLRHSEVLADATSLLAMECARKRKTLLTGTPRSKEEIKLAASHRVARAQSFDFEGYTAHFRIFSLCTAGRGEENSAFEIRNITEHVHFYLGLLRKLFDHNHIRRIEVKLFDLDGKDNTGIHEAVHKIVEKHDMTSLLIEKDSTFGRNYYKRLRFMINVSNKDGLSLDYIDGGFTDWTAKLLSDDKERLLTSGAGSELLLKMLKLQVR